MIRKKHALNTIEKLGGILSEPLPQQTAMSTQQVIAKFATQIRARLDAGETYDEIATRFAQAEIAISGATIRAYMSRARRKRSRDRRVDVVVTAPDTVTQQRRDRRETSTDPAAGPAADDGFPDLDMI